MYNCIASTQPHYGKKHDDKRSFNSSSNVFSMQDTCSKLAITRACQWNIHVHTYIHSIYHTSYTYKNTYTQLHTYMYVNGTYMYTHTYIRMQMHMYIHTYTRRLVSYCTILACQCTRDISEMELFVMFSSTILPLVQIIQERGVEGMSPIPPELQLFTRLGLESS